MPLARRHALVGLVGLVGLVFAAPSLEVHQAYAETRHSLCNAVISEMHIEIHKHSLRKSGEDDIYETVPAICLAIVQNYTLRAGKPPARAYTLDKRATRLDDDVDAQSDLGAIQHLMTLKGICELFAEDFQQELSELMYKGVLERDAEELVAEFCDSAAVANAPLPPPPPKRRKARPQGHRSDGGGGGSGEAAAAASQARQGKAAKKKKKEKAAGGGGGDEGQGGVPSSMDDLLAKYDTDGSIANMLEMERENPAGMLGADELAEVERGAADIRCDVCTAAAKVGAQRARKRRLSRDEDALAEVVRLLCYERDPDDLSAYPTYPGNPPRWGEMYTVGKEEARDAAAEGGEGGGSGAGGPGRHIWRMRRLPKGATPEERGGGKGYDEMVLKHSMITRACKQTILERDEFAPRWAGDDDGDLAQVLYERHADTPHEVAARYCRPFCERAPPGARTPPRPSASRPKDEV